MQMFSASQSAILFIGCLVGKDRIRKSIATLGCLYLDELLTNESFLNRRHSSVSGRHRNQRAVDPHERCRSRHTSVSIYTYAEKRSIPIAMRNCSSKFGFRSVSEGGGASQSVSASVYRPSKKRDLSVGCVHVGSDMYVSLAETAKLSTRPLEEIWSLSRSSAVSVSPHLFVFEPRSNRQCNYRRHLSLPSCCDSGPKGRTRNR